MNTTITTNSQKQGIRDKSFWGFAFYDFANSSYLLIFNAFLFPLFLKDRLKETNYNVDLTWSIILAISVLIAFAAGVWVGRLADRIGRRKVLKYLSYCTIVGVSILVLITNMNVSILCAVFILTNACFTLSLTVYDSLISHLGNSMNRTAISGFAWGFGYVGGILCLILVVIGQKYFSSPYVIGFIITLLFYTVFTFISLQKMKSIKESLNTPELNISASKVVFPKAYLMLILGIWLVSEGIDIIIYFTSLFGSQTIGLSNMEIGKLLILLQLIAFPATLFFTSIPLRNWKYTAWQVLKFSILIWIIIVLGLLVANLYWHMVALVILTSLVIGTSQSILRSEFSKSVPALHSGFHFSIFSILTRSANIIGPLIFGIISDLTGSQKVGFGSVIVFLVIGIFTIRMAISRNRELLS